MSAEHVQGSEAWKQARLGKATASRFADIMTNGRGGNPSKVAETYMLDLLSEIITGKPSDEINSKYLEWGNRHEASARSAYCWDKGVEVSQVGFVNHPTIKRCGGSPDSLVDEDGILEIKCPYNTTNHLRTLLSYEVPSEYQWQVQGNLWVTQRKWCDFISYDPRFQFGVDHVVIRVERDELLIEELEDRVVRFLQQLEVKLAKIQKRVA